MANKTIKIVLITVFCAVSLFTACDLYSQAELKVKGLKVFSGEDANINAIQKKIPTKEIESPVKKEPAAATAEKVKSASSDVSQETKDYNAFLAEINALKKETAGLQRELDVMRSDQNIFGPDFVKRKDEKTPAALKEDAIRKLKEKNKELETKVKEAMAKAKEAEKKAKEAEAKAKEAAKKDKAKLYFELGNSYARAKLYKKAIEAFSASAEADPSNRDTYYNLGFLYQRYQGDTDKSIENFKKYLNRYPPPDKRREVKFILEMLRTGREWISAYY